MHPLERKIAALRSRLRWLVVVYGLSWIVAAVLAAVLVLGWIDYLVRFQDRGLRVICSLAVLGVWGWTVYRYLYLGLSARLRDVDLALRLQRRYSALGDGLASAVEFLKQSPDDPTAGSPALRQAVIAQTTAETDELDFAEVIRKGPTLRATMTALGTCLVTAIMVTLAPLSSRTAVARLANPFGATVWPRTYHLVLRDPVERIARGQTFEVRATDRIRRKLPPDVRIHYRFEESDGAVREQTEPMRVTEEVTVFRQKGEKITRRKEVAEARLPNVAGPFSYWVEGGDDSSMARRPISVEVVEPPALESVSIKLIPPEYTGWAIQKVQNHIRALVGTRIEITARSTRPLLRAALCMAGVDLDRKIPAGVSDDGYRVTIPAGDADLIVGKSGSYWFELTDRRQVTSGGDTRWEIRATADEPPTVAIEQPTATVFVTSRAVVPLRVVAKDDLAVERVELAFNRLDSGEKETVLPIHTGPTAAGSRQQAAGSDPQSTIHNPQSERRVVDFRWDLGSLELQPQTQIVFHAIATDYRAQSGSSQPRRLVIITPKQLADRLAGRQDHILADLARVLEMQRQSRSRVAALEIRAAEVGYLDRQDVDRLRGAELNQRQINGDLLSRDEGVAGNIVALLADLENNKVDSPDVARRMRALLDRIDRLGREHLPVIDRELTAAIKATEVMLQERAAGSKQQAARSRQQAAGSGQQAANPQSTIHNPQSTILSTAGAHQDQVIAALEQMLGQLAQWDNYRRFHRDIGQLVRDQEELAARTSELGRDTLTKELKDLLPRELADLKILSRQQLEIARRLDRIQQAMEQSGDRLRDSDPLAAETVADALDRARTLSIGGQMRQAGDHLLRNQIGQATGRQRQIVEGLQEILDILANRRQHELVRLVKKLRQAEGDLAELAQRQEGLRKKIQQAAETTDEADEAERRRRLEKLAREQGQLEEETERMSRRLERLLADRAGQTTRQAAEKMDLAGQAAGQGKCQDAGRKALEAEKDLEDARRQLAQQRRQAEVELATEQLARLEDALTSLHGRQQKALDETGRLDGLRQTQGQLTEAQGASLRDLAREQKLLKQQTDALAEELAGADVFILAVSGAAGRMAQAAALLQRRRTGIPTRQAQQDALGRLSQLLEALKPEEPTNEPDAAAGGAGGAGQGGAPGGGVQTLAELKLLKLLQEEVNLRTRQLEETIGRVDRITDQQRLQYTELGQQQRRLADLLMQLIQPVENPEEQNP